MTASVEHTKTAKRTATNVMLALQTNGLVPTQLDSVTFKNMH